MQNPFAALALAGGLSILACVASAQSGALIYECAASKTSRTPGLVSDRMVLILEKTGQVKVADGAIMEVYKQPIPVSVTGNTSSRMTLRWTVRKLSNGYQTVDVSFHVVFDKTTGRYTTRADVQNYSNHYVGKGTCKARQG